MRILVATHETIACGLDPETPHLAESVGTEWDLLYGIAHGTRSAR